jgi:[protein-PII] uridylyltransferase
MAKSFLNAAEIAEGLRGFQASGQWLASEGGQGIEFSEWLEAKLVARLSHIPEWIEVGAVALGSWARGELSPRSDIDVLLIGDESKILSFVTKLTSEGVKLRYRVPEDIQDWTVGVEPFDVLAVLHGRALNECVAEALEHQKTMIRKRGSRFLRTLMRAMGEERRERSRRYDSITNYLEPNLKYGPGGLRDLQQALYVHELFIQKFQDQVSHNSIEVFSKYRQFFLTIRRRLHLMGGGDSVSAGDQKELALWFGYTEVKSFMRDIQVGLSRVSFYADWMVNRARASKKYIDEVESVSLNKASDCFAALQSDPSRLVQGKVRSVIENLVQQNPDMTSVGRWLTKYFQIDQSEEYILALFKAKIMDCCIPDLKRVGGLVQHDQYHRFTVDAHLQQAIREVQRIYRRPSRVGKLKLLVKEMTSDDWKILMWTALYHDLAKGLGGDHSKKGAELVKRDFIAMKLPLRLTVEVAWMVERHLDISTAAFRMNPHSSSTWQKLHHLGIKGDRLKRLTLFTAVDIMATNPEAWSNWKERLLMDLYSVVTSPRAGKFVKLLECADQSKVQLSDDFIDKLDPSLPEQIPDRYLLADFRKLQGSDRGDLELFIWKAKGKEYWIRFHSREDRPGLFLEWTKILFASGCQILQAVVQTYENFGAYDWFRVKSSRTPAQLKKWMSFIDLHKVTLPEAKFDRVKLVNQDENEAVLSFRGKDCPGLLLTAAQALAQEGCSIRWAKAFTWGRQVDDVFGVKLEPDLAKRVENIARKTT